MAKRRSTIDPNLFARTEPEGEPSRQEESTPSGKRRAVTFYFDESTIARLHDVWIAALAEDPKATKSGIVEEAVRRHLSAKD